MLVTIVYITVKPEYIEQFKEACRLNHEGSIREPGNFRFDVLQLNDEPSKFVLYESYLSQKDVDAHKQTAHYITWRDTVADWMAETRQGVKYTGLYPQAT